MKTPDLHSLIYVYIGDGGTKLALVAKVGRTRMHLIQCCPDVRVKRLPMDSRWSYSQGNASTSRPGLAYRRLGRKHGITKAASRLLRGVE